MWHILDFYLNIFRKDFSFSAITVMLLTTNIPFKEQYALLMLLYIKKIKKYVLSLILLWTNSTYYQEHKGKLLPQKCGIKILK